MNKVFVVLAVTMAVAFSMMVYQIRSYEKTLALANRYKAIPYVAGQTIKPNK